MHISFNINGGILAGSGMGAAGLIAGVLILILPYLPFILLMIAAGKAHASAGSILKLLPLAVAGAVVGGSVTAAGLPWWAAGLVTFCLGLAVMVSLRCHHKRRHA